MPYLGNEPAVAYTSTTKDTFSGDASTTDFTMSKSANVNAVRVVVENVVQNPTVAYTCSGTTISFTSAPPSGTNNIYVVHLGPPAATVAPPTTINNATTFTGGISGDLAVDTNTLFVDSTNNHVGFGTQTPAKPLSVNLAGGGDFIAEFQNTTDATPYGIHVKDAASGANGYPLFQVTNGGGTETYLRVDSGTGNTGLGTSAPLRQLHISNTSANSEIAFTAGTSGVSSILFGDGQTGTDIYRGYLQYNHADDAMLFASSATERMRIDSSGTVLVGASTRLASASTLELHGSGNYFIQRNTGATAGQYWRHEVDTNNTLYIVNASSAGVYIVNGGTSFSSLSDETLKENITDVGNVLDKVKNYRTSRFNWVGGQEDDTRIGFIAQDWVEDFPEVVSTAKDDKLGLNYTETIPVLLKAIQELSAKVDALETENTTQATQIADLITRVTALEAE